MIECPIVDELDCNGWDVRKALHLFTRTNVALLEWLRSPIRYVERGGFAESLRELAPRAFNPTALCYHYGHMARRNVRDHLMRDQVKLKKHLYVLRPLFAVIHLERGLGLPPVAFQALVDAAAPDAIRQAVARLVERKRQSPERGLVSPIAELDGFIATELGRLDGTYVGAGRPDMLDADETRNRLNAVFRAVVRGQLAHRKRHGGV